VTSAFAFDELIIVFEIEMSTSNTPEGEAIALTVSSLASLKSSTVSNLSESAPSSESYLSSHLSLVRPSTPNPPKIIIDLVLAAQKAASVNALACGSILAGPSSDSTEYGDVGVWLGEGPYSRGHEKDVLKALGLVAWSEEQVCRYHLH
jgi:hypothetical protein